MGRRRTPQKVVPFTGIIKRKDFTSDDFIDMLKDVFCEEVIFSEIIPFSHTEYYKEEMGENLERLWIGFLTILSPENSHLWKVITNSIENLFKRDGKRQVNIDPGYVSLNGVVLFTTKNYTHRLYMGNGIYGELTLFYRKGSFHPFEWTYPDYREKVALDFFCKLRSFLKDEI